MKNSAKYPSFYPPVMRSKGEVISSEIAAKAFTKWSEENYRGNYIRLSNWIEFFQDGLSLNAQYVFAERIIRRARQEGIIQPTQDRKSWEPVFKEVEHE